jgi:hypothetical protein
VKRFLPILLAFLLSGCAILRHDAVVEGVFPGDGESVWQAAIETPEGFAP